MPQLSKRYRVAPRKRVKEVQPSLKNVVSLRVTDQEKELLETVTRETSRNISDVVREAITFWLAMRETICFRTKTG